jgi:WD repeat-containing protein 68
MEQLQNKIEIVQLDEKKKKIIKLTSLEHSYPPTKIKFFPDNSTNNPDLLATSSDFLRIYKNEKNNSFEIKSTLNKV